MGRLVRRRHVAGSSPDATGLEAPEPFNFTRDVVELRAADTQRRALRFVDAQGVIDKRTFDDVAGAAGRWAALLRSRGLTPGDHVVVLLGPSPTWPAVLLGALKAGLVVAPCPEAASNDELELQLRHSDARLLVVDSERAATLAALDAVVQVLAWEEVASELRGLSAAQPTYDTTVDDAAMILSPADTPEVTLSHGAVRGALELVEHGLDVRPDDIIWCAAETGSSTWLWNGLLVPWAAGAATVIHGADFDPQQRLELIQRLGVTVLRQGPDEYRQLVDQPVQNGELDGLRRAVSVGGRLDPDVADAFRALCGLTVEEELEDGMLVEESGASEPPTVAANGPVDTLSDRVSAVTIANVSLAVLAAPRAAAAAQSERAARDEVATVETKRLEDERRDAERRAAEEKAAEQRQAEEAQRAAEAEANADERDRKQRQKDAAKAAKLAERRAEQERKAAAARAEADARERNRQEAAAVAEAQRAAAEARRAAEAKAKVDERERKQREKDAAKEAKLAERRAEEERKAAAAQAEADARERKRQEAAAAAAAQRAAAEARRAAEAKAKDDERLRKEQEKEAAKEAKLAQRRAEEERKAAAAQAEVDARERKRQEAAAAAEAQRAAAEARRAAEAKAKADERERKEQEKAVAAQARRDEAERRAAEQKAEADRRAAAKLEQLRSAEQAHEEAKRPSPEPPADRPEPVAVAAVNGSEDQELDDVPNEALMERLRAYTHHKDDVSADPPPQ